MVEGPGATRNARKLQPAVGCQVLLVEEGSNAFSLNGQTLLEAYCVGKEVFLVFSNDVALRLHFGMNGSLSLSSDGKPPFSRYKRQQPASLRLQLERCEPKITFLLECYGTNVTQVSTRVARSKRDRLQHLDCCVSAELFQPNQVVSALRSRPDTMICDALLDQNKYPGVGNIIKIEGLHKAKIHPKRLVRSLTDMELQITVRECRQYAMGWFQSGRAPLKHVYNRTTCASCQSVGSVRMVKLGKDLGRVTFFCDQCQPPQDFSTTTQPSVDSLSGKKRPFSHQNDSKGASKQRTLHQPLRCNNACPQHGSRTFCIKRVRHSPKEGNIFRLFGTCKVKGCPFFVWVDTHFPNCTGCRGKTVLRVSKKEHSSGRWFFSCGNKNAKQTCQETFAWATPAQLAPLGKHLTPLL